MDVITVVVYLVSALICTTDGVHSNCPIACSCGRVSGNFSVDCRTGYWKRMPDIPKGTESLHVRNSKFGILRRPSSCQNFAELTALNLRSCGITAIEDDAFECSPGLRHLNIRKNHLRSVSSAALSQLVYLQFLFAKENKFQTEVIPNLCNLENIRWLDLSWNKLKITPNTLDCLGHLKHLSHIDLSQNQIQGSVKRVLKPLLNVSTIIAEFCKISTPLEAGTFSGFKAVTVILKHNKIKEIHRYAFANATNLRQLIMDNNPITGGSEWIAELPAIEQLHLEHIGLRDVPVLPKTIRYVDLSSNRISNLTNHSFYGLNELECLVLKHGKIHKVEKNTFSNLPRLKILKLDDTGMRGNLLQNISWGLANSSLEKLYLPTNPVQSLSKTTFEYFVPNKLRKLSLKDCKIKLIESETFENLTHLEHLDLSKNQLCEMEPKALSGLDSLSILHLAKNRLSEFSCETSGIKGSPLKVLNLGENFFRKYSFTSLLGLEGLEVLNLGKNRITSIKSSLRLSALKSLDLGNNGLQHIAAGVFSNFTGIIKLDLTDNQLTQNTLGLDILQDMVNLVTLRLSGTNLGSDGNDTLSMLWAGHHKLKSLQLADCRITALVPGMFSSLRSLESLILSFNYISSVDPSAFANATALRALFLDRNRITVVNWKSFVNLPNLRQLSLAGNPLLCTCESLWIFQKMRSQELYIPSKTKRDAIQCKPTGELHYKKFHFKVTDCEEPWALILKPIAIGFAGVSAIFGLYVLWYYRWHIRYTLFLARAGRHRYMEMQEGVEHKYDAFVAYSSPDLPWVKQHLLPNVDTVYFGPDGFRLCLHHRDWLVGEDITENIRKSIVESRRTIIVLSKAFAESYWCKFELAMAHMRLDAEGHGKNRLLVILLDDIPAHLLTAHLRHILTTKTYITWPQEPALQQCFWKAIRKSLKKQLFYE